MSHIAKAFKDVRQRMMSQHSESDISLGTAAFTTILCFLEAQALINAKFANHKSFSA